MSETRPPIALSIAGSDPTGGAGLQLDLRVFERHGVYGMAVPTALTIQTTKGVHQVLPVFPNVVGEQLHFLLGDIVPDVIKIGMLASDDVLLRVAMVLDRCDAPRIVDPVMVASDGSVLLERRALRSFCERILPGAALLTPNLSEAEALTGTRDPEAAARALLDLGAKAALVKGGHAEGPADDFLLTAEGGSWLRAPRLDAGPVHGTGCALSSAIAARTALGDGIEAAVRGAKEFVGRAIAQAASIGGGQRVLRFDDIPA